MPHITMIRCRAPTPDAIKTGRKRCRSCGEKGIALASDSVPANEAPDDAAAEACKAPGKALA